MFAPREFADVQRKLINALREEGRQVLMYGDTGVGKTNLLRIVTAELGMKAVSADCSDEVSFDETLHAVLGQLGVGVKTKTTAGGVIRTDVRGEAGFLGLKLGGGVGGEDARTEEYEYRAAGTARQALEACHEAGVRLVVLDNFENVQDPRVRARFAELIKFLADHTTDYGNLKLVIIGIATTAEALLTDDDSVIRRTVQIPVPRMPIGELKEILHKGGRLLRLEFDDEAAFAIGNSSDGFPYFTHLLGLHASRRALESGERTVTVGIVRRAIVDAIGEVQATIRSAVTRAEERGAPDGQRMRFVKTGADTNGELLQIECVSAPHGAEEPLHVHPRQQHRFEVLEGTLRFEIAGQRRDLVPGDPPLFIAPATAHRFWNPGTVDARYVQEFRPALHIEEFFESLFALARDGKLDAKGSPSLLQISVMVPRHSDEIRLVSPPWPVVRVLTAVLAPVARLLGYRAVCR